MEQRENPAGEESKSLQSVVIKGCYFDKRDKNKKHKRLQQEAQYGRRAFSFLRLDLFAMVSHAWLLEAILSDLSLLFILLAVTVVWNVLNRAMLGVWNAFKSLSAAFWFILQAFCTERIALMIVTSGSAVWDSVSVQCCRKASKRDTQVGGSIQHILTNVSWASSLPVRCFRGLQGIIADIWLFTLYHIKVGQQIAHSYFLWPVGAWWLEEQTTEMLHSHAQQDQPCNVQT